MRKVIEVVDLEASAFTSRALSEKPWWQTCSVSEFKTRSLELSVNEQLALSEEIRGALAVVKSAIDDPRDDVHRIRAKRAHAYMVEKRRLLTSVMLGQGRQSPDRPTPEQVAVIAKQNEENRQRNEGYKFLRKQKIAEARVALESGDLHGTVDCLLSAFETDVERERKKIEQRKALATTVCTVLPSSKKKADGREHFFAAVAAAREAFSRGDLTECVHFLLDMMAPQEPPQRA